MKIEVTNDQILNACIEYLREEKKRLVSKFTDNGKSISTDIHGWAYDNMAELIHKINSIQTVIDHMKDEMRTNVFSDGYITANLIYETMTTAPASEFHGMIYDPMKDVLNTYDTLPCDTEPK